MDLVAGFCAHLYKNWNARLVSLFADDVRGQENVFHLYYVFALDAAHGFFILRVPVPADKPEFPSLTNAIPAVSWQEREIQDLFGLKLIGHPNPRRCALHDDWPDVHPLRKDFDLHTQLPPFQGERHKFREVEGEGVFQVPVGPVHAGIIEPGHFLFSVAGEPVLYLQMRLFYTHKGTEKLFENLPVTHGVRLAESISGDSSFAHATAFCHAVERAAGRGSAAAGARAPHVFASNWNASTTTSATSARLRPTWRLWWPTCTPCGSRNACCASTNSSPATACCAAWPASAACASIGTPRKSRRWRNWSRNCGPEFDSLVELIENSSSTRDRLEDTGILKPKVARDLGVVGIAGRASGFDHDLRRDFPHAAYDRVKFRVPVYQEGDVEHRMQVRIDEVRESLSIIQQLVADLPAGPVRVEIGELPAGRTALGYVEGWRGEIFHWIRTAPGNRLARCKVKDPSLQNWPALSEAILGNIVPDFPVVNKSFNLSYSGTDR